MVFERIFLYRILKPPQSPYEAEKAGGDKEDDGAENSPEYSGDSRFAASVEHRAQAAASQRSRADDDAKAFTDLGQHRRDTVQACIHRTRTDVGDIYSVLL